MLKYISAQKMVRDFRKVRWSYQRIGRFSGLPASTLIRIASGKSIPRESTEEKIRVAHTKIFSPAIASDN